MIICPPPCHGGISFKSSSAFLSIASGCLVGFSLGLFGGGGSILALPLLVYVVGVNPPHLAIGTSALAVSCNAFANLIPHARVKHIHWDCGIIFTVAGVVGAAVGKMMDGNSLLFLFGLMMFAVAFAMLHPRAAGESTYKELTTTIIVKLIVAGFTVGMFSGFFGIGGGFLIVPAMMLGSGMAMINAVGSSLLCVGAFGLTTALSYAWSGLVNWHIAAWFILGGIAGGVLGTKFAIHLSKRRIWLTRLFASAVMVIASFILWKSKLCCIWN